jgi:hypothetical protein
MALTQMHLDVGKPRESRFCSSVSAAVESHPGIEQLRRRFLPTQVRVLFVGESPPAGGTFFYSANSILYEATKDAFRRGVPTLVRGANFLERFKAMGCYLDDLCAEPVNQWKLTNSVAREKRLRAREDNESTLTNRIREYAPREIVVVMKGIEPNVRRTAEQAGFGDHPIHPLPFPRREHRARYVDELSHLLRQMQGRGTLSVG